MIEERGHWRVLSRESKYENDFIELVEDRVITDRGKEGLFGVIKTNDAVSTLPIDDDGFVYLNKEFKYAANKEIITSPGGFIDKGEQPLEAAKRELLEESGISAKDWLPLGKVYSFASISTSGYSLFIARKLDFMQSNQEEMERIRPYRLSLKDAFEMVKDGEINYAPTVILILRAFEMQNN